MSMTRAKVYLILQTVLCVLLVVLLSASAIGIYRDGMARRAENPRAAVYSREIAADRFAPIAPLAFIAVGMLIAGLVVGVRDENGEKPVKDSELARDLAVARVARPSPAMTGERAVQRRLSLAGWGVFAACMVPVAIYLVNPDHFPLDDLEGMFYALIRVFLPWVIVGIGALAVTSAMREKHVLLETEAAREQMKQEKAEGVQPPTADPPKPRNHGAIRAILIVAALAFIVLGAFNQSARDVLYKAITICTECVGLG